MNLCPKRVACKYGIRCSRQNPVHRVDESHPGDDDYTMPDYEKPPTGVPACPFGDECYRRNPVHFQQFSHPSLVPQTCEEQDTTQLDHLDPLGNNVTAIENIQLAKALTIRARVTIKSDKHLFANAKGVGIMSTMDLVDKTGEIRLTAFGAIVHQIFDLVEVDKIYYFANFTVRIADSLPGVVQINKFQLICNESTRIVPDTVNRMDLPQLSFDFEPISSIDLKNKNDLIDIIAICDSYGPLVPVTLKNAEKGSKRELFLVDNSKKEIMLTIWGTNAESFDRHNAGLVIAVKRARVTDWAGKSLDSSCLSSSTFKVNPDLHEAHVLRKWRANESDRD